MTTPNQTITLYDNTKQHQTKQLHFTEIDPNNYWTTLSGKGQVHKFFVYVEVVDEDNRDNVFSMYVDSTLSITSLKNKILMHENKDPKTWIRLRIKIDKGSSVRKQVDLSDDTQHETKHTKSLQDVMTKFSWMPI